MLVHGVQNDSKDEIDELMNDSNTEFIAREEIELTDNPGNANASKLEVNIHVVDIMEQHILKN